MQLAFERADFGNEMDVTTSSLDYPEYVPPKDNTHTARRLKWVPPDTLLDYRENRQVLGYGPVAILKPSLQDASAL
jgi:hypothetical protein